jgi:predicted PurR-regulated permease PerM
LVLVLAFVVFVGALLLLMPLLQQQLSDLIGKLPDLVAVVREKIMNLIAFAQSRVSPETAAKVQDSVGGVLGDLAGNLAKPLGGLLAGIWTSGMALVNVLSLLFITPLVAFYMLDDWDRIVTAVDNQIPRRSVGTARYLARDIDNHLAGYVRGVSMICLILAVYYGTALSVVGLDFGLIIGLLIGLLSFIPFVGAIVGFVLSVGLALVQFSEFTSVLLVVGIFVVGQVVEGNVLQPWLVGRSVNLHPVWIIFALLAGGTVFGFLGVLLGVPIAVVIGSLLRFALRRYRESPLYKEQALPPPEAYRGMEGQGRLPAAGGPDRSDH